MLLQFVEDGTDAFLKLSTIFGASHYGRHVKHHYTLVKEDARHLLLYDTQGQSLHDGRLTHTGLTDEYGVVLFTAA